MKDYSKTGPTPGLGLDAPSYTWVTGDIDGDGRDEFVILHPRLPSLVTVSVFGYADVGLPAPASGGGQLVGTSYVAGAVAGNWQLNPSDQLTIADVDGDGTDEILIYQAASGYMGVVKAQRDGSLLCLWAQGAFPATFGMSSTALQCIAVDLDGDLCDELLLFDPTTSSVAVAKWRDAELEGLWHGKVTGGGLQIESWDVFTPAGSVDGRVGATVVAWSADDEYLCLLGWDGAQLTVLGEPSHGQVGELQLDGSLRLLVTDASPPELIVFSLSGGALPVVTWTGTSFAWTGNTNQAGPGGSGANLTLRDVATGDINGDSRSELVAMWEDSDGSVYLDATTLQTSGATWTGIEWAASKVPAYLTDGSFVMADVDGDGRAEVVALSASGNAIGVLSASGTAFTEIFAATDRITGFNRALIAAAGVSTFTDFTGTQLKLYLQVSQELGVTKAGGLRAAYPNVFDALDIPSWVTALRAPTWTWMEDYDQADIDAVIPTLLSECQSLAQVASAYNYFDTLANNIAADYATSSGACTTTINKGPVHVDSDSKLTYWAVGVLEALPWALAAVPGLDVAAMPLAVGASLFGTLANEWVPGDGEWGTTTGGNCTSALDDLSTAISQTQPKLDAERTKVAKDPAKLAWLGTAFGKQWAYAPDQKNDPWYGTSAMNAQKVAIYQLLLPAMYRLAVYKNTIYPYPTYRTFESPHLVKGLDAPNNSYWTVPVSSGRWDVYLLCVGTKYEDIGYPPGDLTKDLFTNLAIDPTDLYGGRYGWDAIAHFDGATITRGSTA